MSRLFYTRNALYSMSKPLNYICIFIITGCLLFACHFTEPLKVKPPPLKVSCVPFVGYTPLIIAQEKGFFKAQGTDVELKLCRLRTIATTRISVQGRMMGVGLNLGKIS